jgi:hypothetical protein
MNSKIALLIFLFSLVFVFPEATKKENKNKTVKKQETSIKTGIEILANKNFQIILPSESGFRKDLYDLNGILLESEYLNAKGNLVESEPNVAIEKRKYNASGFLEEIKTFDKLKNISSRITFSYDSKCVEIKKSEDCLKEVSSLNGEDNPIEDENGIHKYKMEFDPTCIGIEKHKVSECRTLEVNLNKKLKLVEDNNGNAKVVRTFDTFGNLNLHEIYDRSNKIKHKLIYAYDYKCIEITGKPQACIIFHEYSNRIDKKENKSSFENVNYGKRIIQYDLNCVKEKQNAENCISLEENYDINGKLQDIAHRFTFGCLDYSVELGAYAKKTASFDKKGNEILREFYNAKNQLIEDSSGGAKYIFAYSQACLDNGHKPHDCKTLSEVYDKNLKLKYKAIFDENCVKTGKANLESPNYCTAWKETYDSKEVAENKKDSIKIVKANFDQNGFKIDLEKYNIYQKLSVKTIYLFDKEKLIKKENQDVNGKPIEDSDGIATYLYKYENSKFTTREETLGKNGRLKANPDGIARMIFAYNENCLKKKSNRYECTTLEEFHDQNENLIELKSNGEDTHSYAKMVREFDSNGNLILEAYYDKDHKLKKNQKGIAKYKFNYDTNGDLLSEDHFGKKNNLKRKIQYSYDPKCKALSNDFSCNTSIAYFSKKNVPVDKLRLDGIQYAEEITSYNYDCIKTTSEPEECLEKKEFLNSKKEIVFAEYFQYSKPPTPKSEIKLIKLKLTQDKIPYSAEFIK